MSTQILFLDQTGNMGGAELVLLDVATFYKETCCVALFEDGPFRAALESRGISVKLLGNRLVKIKKDSGLFSSLISSTKLIPLIYRVVRLSQNYDLIYANTLKSFIVGSLASSITRKPFIFHFHDLLQDNYFSSINKAVVVQLANRFSSQVITASKIARDSFIQAGGKKEIVRFIYSGFDTMKFAPDISACEHLKKELRLEDKFIVGCFGRLDRGKGQDVLLEAISHCPNDVVALIVGGVCFGQDDYEASLHQQAASLGIENRVRFLGFRSNIAPLMACCDVVTNPSKLPESFGRVIVEAMLAGKTVISSRYAASLEIIEPGKTGVLVPTDQPQALYEAIDYCYHNRHESDRIAQQSQKKARSDFSLSRMRTQIHQAIVESLNSGESTPDKHSHKPSKASCCSSQDRA